MTSGRRDGRRATSNEKRETRNGEMEKWRNGEMDLQRILGEKARSLARHWPSSRLKG